MQTAMRKYRPAAAPVTTCCYCMVTVTVPSNSNVCPVYISRTIIVRTLSPPLA
jgi:hypothetical protein